MTTQGTNQKNPPPLSSNNDKPIFQIKNWNFTAFWEWKVEADTCAICRADVSDSCLKCQSEKTPDECVAVWGQCNHSFHHCCMLKWTQQSNRCPLCQQEWINCISHEIHHNDRIYSNRNEQ